MDSKFDLIVLGAGSAGFAAANVARDAGWSVLVVEATAFGGTCALRGCVPKKVLVAAAETLEYITMANEHKINTVKAEVDWPALIGRTRTFVEGVPNLFENNLKNQGVEVLQGNAKFISSREISVDGEIYQAKKFVIATGSKPRHLPIAGFEYAVTSDHILECEERPESMVFIGCGVVGLEFSHVFARAGTKVTMLELLERPLSMFDSDAVASLTEESQRIGIDIRTSVKVTSISKMDSGFKVVFVEDGREQHLQTQVVANGTGHIAAVENLELDAANINHDRYMIYVDEYLRSKSNPNVLVAGDANAAVGPQLSPVATYEGKIVGHNLLCSNGEMQTADYHNIPSCVFTIPPLASVGYLEATADAQGLAFEVKTNDMREWRSSKTYAETASFAKVLVEKETGKVLGAHLLGHGAAETIHLFAFAITHGVTADQLVNTVYAYPTFSSDIKFLV